MSLRTVLAAAALLGTSFGCGSSYSTPSGPSPTPSGNTGTPVSIVSGASGQTTTAYAPNPITVAVGGSVTWTNNDNTSHTSTANNGAWNSGVIAAGGKYSMTFASAGSFTYHCTLHPGMVGTVTVQ